MNGIINVWKERGMTSHDVVFKLRKLLKTKKVGHTGTLDPEVDGVLPICIGQATKLVQILIEKDKVYTGSVLLGKASDTEDLTGTIVKQQILNADEISEVAVDQAMQTFIGTYLQVPPMYSAVKINGKKLYEYARKGEVVDRPGRPVTISEFNRLSPLRYQETDGTFELDFLTRCSKGTYVRTLATDLGQKLGVPALMSQLTRIQSGPYRKENVFTLAQIEQCLENQDTSFLQSLESVFKDQPIYHLSDEEWQKVQHGQKMVFETANQEDTLVLYYNNMLKALYRIDPSNPPLYKPFIMTLQNGGTNEDYSNSPSL